MKCLYRHLFLSKRARSLKKWHFLICGKHNSKAPRSYVCHKLGSAIFLVALACLDISSKKRCQWRFFTYHLKAHIISNKLVSKVFVQNKGEKVMSSQKCVQISEVSGRVPP